MPDGIDPERIPFAPGGPDVERPLHTGDARIDAFALWLSDDVDPLVLVEICDALGQRMTGAETTEDEFSGNAWVAIIAPDAVEVRNHFNDQHEFLSPTDAALVLHGYWDYLRERMRPARFDRYVQKFANRHQRPPNLPWKHGTP